VITKSAAENVTEESSLAINPESDTRHKLVWFLIPAYASLVLFVPSCLRILVWGVSFKTREKDHYCDFTTGEMHGCRSG